MFQTHPFPFYDVKKELSVTKEHSPIPVGKN